MYEIFSLGAEPVSRGPWNNGAGAPLCRESLLTQGSRIILPSRKGSHSSLSLPPARTGSGRSPETKLRRGGRAAGRPSRRAARERHPDRKCNGMGCRMRQPGSDIRIGNAAPYYVASKTDTWNIIPRGISGHYHLWLILRYPSGRIFLLMPDVNAKMVQL